MEGKKEGGNKPINQLLNCIQTRTDKFHLLSVTRKHLSLLHPSAMTFSKRSVQQNAIYRDKKIEIWELNWTFTKAFMSSQWSPSNLFQRWGVIFLHLYLISEGKLVKLIPLSAAPPRNTGGRAISQPLLMRMKTSKCSDMLCDLQPPTRTGHKHFKIQRS